MKIFPATRAAWIRCIAPVVLMGAGAGAWLAWHPGQTLRTGAHDLGSNGVWMAHGWLADDQWFMQNAERASQLPLYHNTPSVIAALQEHKNRGMGHVFLDLYPCATDGSLPPASISGAEMLGLQAAHLGIHAWPWVGGTRGENCFPEKPEWRRTFVSSCRDLLLKCPDLAGVLVNVEPWPENDPHMPALLDELRQAMPKGRHVAVAAFPPPTLFQPGRSNHWGKAYFQSVAAKSDLLVVMMHDTGLSNDKLFTHLIECWTKESVQWAGETPVLLGIADYETPIPQPWHHAPTETLEHALSGIHAGLSSFGVMPGNYRGVAVFADYTMDARKWNVWETEFCAPRKKITVDKPPTLEDLMKGAVADAGRRPPGKAQGKTAPPVKHSAPEPPPMLRRPPPGP